MEPIAVSRLKLQNVGPFEQIDLTFPGAAGITLICGDNGIGKSSILEALAAPFGMGPQRLKKKAGSSTGQVEIQLNTSGRLIDVSSPVKAFGPEERTFGHGQGQFSRYLVNVRTFREFSYSKRETLSRDPKIDDSGIGSRVTSGLDAQEIKQWFTNRYLLSSHAEKGGWTSSMHENLSSAIQYFSVLDSNVKLHSVDVRTFDIIVSTPSGNIPFEYLSSGFKSSYVLLLGILKEIEFRGIDVSGSQFSGIILIDEIDLHLHPTWQRKIAQVLTDAFPCAQIIATTHSPHVIQAARANQVMALARDEHGHVYRRELPSSRYGYAGWTIDEVLEDVMGVSDTKSSEYRNAVENYDTAMSCEDSRLVEEALAVLREMLHPSNPYRKLIEIESASVVGNDE